MMMKKKKVIIIQMVIIIITMMTILLFNNVQIKINVQIIITTKLHFLLVIIKVIEHR
eukprot:UN01056